MLLYHAAIPGFSGGFIGVDVFFVLSGFLITGLLVRELGATGRVSLPAFYARRARRLLPAAAVALLATVVASAIMLPPLRVPDVTGDAAAAAVYVSNMRFAFQATDYLAAELDPSPLLHFWSLGVEEQFYLFWPAFLALVAGAAFARGAAARGIRRVTVAVAAVFVGSLGISLWLTVAAEPWAFFTLPARAWELALGGMLALPIGARPLPRTLAPLAGWLGLGMVVLAGMVLGSGTPFPGTAALLPTVGAALVIAAGAGPRPAAWAPGRILSTPPFRFLGRISYSLYLWHWPVLVLPAAAFGPLPWPARVALALAAVPIAAASQRWIEDPIRHGRLVGVLPRRNLVLAGALTVAVATTSLGVGALSTAALAAGGPVVGGSLDDVPLPPDATAPVASGPPPTVGPGATPGPAGTPPPSASPTLAPPEGGPVPADLAPSILAARADLPVIYDDGCHLDVPATVPGECAFGAPTSRTTVVLFGDSHAAQWFPTLQRLSTERGWRLVSLTKSACPSADLTVWNGIVKRPYAECDQWRAAAFARIAHERPALVVIANSRRGQLVVDGAPVATADREDLWSAAVARTLLRVQADAGAVVLLGDTPRSGLDPPVCLSDHQDDTLACATPYDAAVEIAHVSSEAAAAAAAGVPFVDPTAWLCRSDPCPVVIGRFLVYRDEHHMTATYARALARRLEAALPPFGG